MSDPEPEPVVEAVAETAAEPEPVAETAAEPEPVAETAAEPEPVAETAAEPEPVAETAAEPEAVAEPEPTAEEKQLEENSHLFAVRTTGGQEKIVMRMLEARLKMGTVDLQSVLLLDDLKGYVVVESRDVSSMFDAIQGLRHVRGQLRGELGI